MKIINLTPYAITLMGEEKITIKSSGIARARQTRVTVGHITGPDGIQIPINKCVYGEVDGLPAPADNTIYIVSAIVAQAAKGRNDIYVVDDTVRDGAGAIIGAKALAKI